MPGPLLVGQCGVRPHQHLDFDGRMCDVVDRKRVGERGQHRRLADAGRAGEQNREHAAQSPGRLSP